MFKVKDKISLNKQHENFIGCDTLWEVIEIAVVDKEQSYVLRKLTAPNVGLVLDLTCKHVNKNYVTILCQEK